MLLHPKNLGGSLGGPPAMVPIMDALFVTNWESDIPTDGSVLAQTFTATGSPSVSGGIASPDGVNDFYKSNQSAAKFESIYKGSPFCIDAIVYRPSSAEGALLSTADNTGSQRGGTVHLFSNGSFRYFSGNGSGIMFNVTWPAGTIPAGGPHSLILEFCNLLAEDAGDTHLYAAINGTRSATTGVATNPECSQGAGTDTLYLFKDRTSAGGGGNAFLAGDVGSMRIMRGNPYDLENNASVTPLANGAFPMTEAFAFGTFKTRQCTADLTSTPNGLYEAFPSTVKLPTLGHAVRVNYNNSRHNGATGFYGKAVKRNSTDFGRTWSPSATISEVDAILAATDDVRNCVLTRISTGRIFLTFSVRHHTGSTVTCHICHSDDDAVSFSAPQDITTAFSSGIQANGAGPFLSGRVIEKDNGDLLLFGYAGSSFGATPTSEGELLRSTNGGTVWATYATVFTGTGQANYLNETRIVPCGGDNYISISRSEDVGDEGIYFASRSSDGCASWTPDASASWEISAVSAPGFFEALPLATGKLFMAFAGRGTDECFYTLTDLAAFFTTPERAWDGTETKVPFHKMRTGGEAGDYGYPEGVEFAPGEVNVCIYAAFHVGFDGQRTRLLNTSIDTN